MEELEKLRKIGAREIAQQTHIALSRIQNILDCNYKDLKDKATLQGLLQILEREYKVNLGQFLNEYDEFWKNYDGKDDESVPLVNFKVTHETIAQGDSTKGVIFGIFIIIILGIGFYAYMKFSSMPAKDETQTQKKQERQVTEEKQETKESAAKEAESPAQALQAPLPVTNSIDSSASSVTSEMAQNQDSNTQNANAVTAEIESAKMPSKVQIVPTTNIWVGVVYLDSGKRTSFMTTQPFEVNLKRPQTIITGHGMLDLDVEGAKTKFHDAQKMFFSVDKEGKFNQITQDVYDTQTRGLGW